MINIAVMGFGVVGGGVVEVLDENRVSIARNAAEEIRVKYILDTRDFPDSPYRELMIKDFSVIENDPDIRIVVETIGGATVAYDFTRRLLLAGKSVVTSNKELVATRGHELIAVARQKNANFLFEASVGGGIPIIRPITQCLAANEIDEVYGILNGTTNYILTQMIQCGESFENARADAQEKGYAEQNPAADIDGIDATRKICILSDLCFGRFIDAGEVKTEGISGVTLADVEFAKKIGYKIKLLGRGLRTGDDRATAYVAPHLLPEGGLLANVDGVMNGIVVHGNAIGEAMFYGAGAGKRPTASAVAADVIDAAKHLKARKFMDWDESFPGYLTDSGEIVSRWYLRVSADTEIFCGGAELIARADGFAAYTLPEMSGTRAGELAGDAAALFRILD